MKKTAIALISVFALGSTAVFAEDGSDRTPLGQQISQSHQEQNKKYAQEHGTSTSKADQTRVSTSAVYTPDVAK